ncbi:class-II fumarase/aspartase family protein [Terriglobus sp.]|uniref:class-II fumarase/aspartase family protein n=1 Tax=Terriglobus sp. TaxID=1889013 RepID=UPI003AFFF044
MESNATAIDSTIYRDIFSTDAMRRVWSDQTRIQRYLDVEKALSVTQGRLGVIPQEAAAEIALRCDVAQMDFGKLKSVTEHVGYPVLPVVEQLTALCKNGLGQWCHWGATTQDITDTATVLQIRDGLELVESDLREILEALAGLAKKHRDTPMVGRSNIQQAIPMTFGYKIAVWLAGLQRQAERLQQMKSRVLMGEFGGAVGTLASLGEKGLPVQKGMMEELGLAQPPIAWHTVRDTMAEVGCFLGLLCGLLDKIATDVKIMMMTELNEVQEPDGGGGRGASSTMPQKRNPISCAYITACSSVVRQHAAALLNAMNADFERATGTWEIEWLVFPEIFCFAAGALAQAKYMLSGLIVHPENMMKDLRLTDGLVNTEAVMMALGPKMGRGKAHDKLSTICIAVSQGKGKLIDLLSADTDISKIFDRKALEDLLDPTKYLGSSGTMVDHVLSLSK